VVCLTRLIKRGNQSWICHEECQDDENEKSDICFVRETNVGVQYFFVLSPSLDRISEASSEYQFCVTELIPQGLTHTGPGKSGWCAPLLAASKNNIDSIFLAIERTRGVAKFQGQAEVFIF
jgi:hypothetical protein